jgi:hypothetical protein
VFSWDKFCRFFGELGNFGIFLPVKIRLVFVFLGGKKNQNCNIKNLGKKIPDQSLSSHEIKEKKRKKEKRKKSSLPLPKNQGPQKA